MSRAGKLCGELKFGAVDVIQMDERYSLFLDKRRVEANLSKSEEKHKDLLIIPSKRVSNA